MLNPELTSAVIQDSVSCVCGSSAHDTTRRIANAERSKHVPRHHNGESKVEVPKAFW
jgi:hypothetical protein